MVDDTPEPPPPARGREGRGLRIALVVSLALNLLIVAALASMVLTHGHVPRSGQTRTGTVDIGRFTAALTDADRRAIRQEYVLRADRLRGARGAAAAELQQLVSALRADPFDPAAIAAVMAEQRARLHAGMETGQALLLDRIAAMTPAERAAYADRLESGAEHGRPAQRRGRRD